MSIEQASSIRVILCDDHPLFRKGVSMMLAENSDIDVVAEVSNHQELRDALHRVSCDVLVLDLNMPGRSGLEVLSSLRAEGSKLPVIIMSMYPENLYVVRCFKAGAQGYVSKTGAPAMLVDAVRTVAKNKKYVTPEIAQLLADAMTQGDSAQSLHQLSEREMETLLRLARGSKLSEIARELMLSPKTVSVYRTRIMEKLRVRSTAEMTAYAIRNQLL